MQEELMDAILYLEKMKQTASVKDVKESLSGSRLPRTPTISSYNLASLLDSDEFSLSNNPPTGILNAIPVRYRFFPSFLNLSTLVQN